MRHYLNSAKKNRILRCVFIGSKATRNMRRGQRRERPFVQRMATCGRGFFPCLAVCPWCRQDSLKEAAYSEHGSKKLSQHTGICCRNPSMPHAPCAVWGLQVQIPAAKHIGVQGPKDNPRLRVLIPDEAEKLLTKLLNLNQPQNADSLLYAYRCRLSGIAHLTWAHVDLTGQTVCFVNTKNKDSCVDYLSQELRKMLIEFYAANINKIVFPRRDGRKFIDKEWRSDLLTILTRL